MEVNLEKRPNCEIVLEALNAGLGVDLPVVCHDGEIAHTYPNVMLDKESGNLYMIADCYVSDGAGTHKEKVAIGEFPFAGFIKSCEAMKKSYVYGLMNRVIVAKQGILKRT